MLDYTGKYGELNPMVFGGNDPKPSKILHYILSMKESGSDEFTYIILGKAGLSPTLAGRPIPLLPDKEPINKTKKKGENK